MSSRRRSSHFFDGFRPGGNKNLADIYAAYGALPDAKPVDVPDDMMWWDEDRVDNTVNRAYVLSHLRASEARRLDQQLEFGDGLTDDTYMEWIETKAKRIFLILVDIGVPDQIFGVVDDSWDDDDLPIPLDQVDRLQLTHKRDQKLEKKFFQRQFTYLLRHLRPGENIIYEDVEIVPLETLDKRHATGIPAMAQLGMDNVCIPGRPDDVFIRRRIPLGDLPGQVPVVEFLSGIEKMKQRCHRHIVSLWGSYIHQSAGYLLLTPVHDTTLKSALAIMPPSLKILAKEDRRILLLDWIHCLTEAVASLHAQGVPHGFIKPSNIFVDSDNRTFFADSGLFAAKSTKEWTKESYDYAAPERPCPLQSASSTSFRSASKPFDSSNRKISNIRRPSTAASPQTPRTPEKSPTFSFATITPLMPKSPKAPKSPSFKSIKSRPPPLQPPPMLPLPMLPSSPTSPSTPIFSRANVHTFKRAAPPPSPPSSPPPPIDPLKCDIFSLGCIYLELLTMLLKRKSQAFASHRSKSRKMTAAASGSSFLVPDTSFRANAAQVESWTFGLLKESKKREDRVYRGVSHLLNLTTRMLAEDPQQRPSAAFCEERTREILGRVCGIKTHCGGPMIPGLPIGMQYMMTGAGTNMPGFGSEAVASMHSLYRNGGTSGARTPVLREREGSVSGTIIDGPAAGPLRGPLNSNSATRNGSVSGIATRNGSVSQGMGQGMSNYGSGGNGSSSSDKSGTGISSGGGRRKVVAKSRPWKAPVYAGR